MVVKRSSTAGGKGHRMASEQQVRWVAASQAAVGDPRPAAAAREVVAGTRPGAAAQEVVRGLHLAAAFPGVETGPHPAAASLGAVRRLRPAAAFPEVVDGRPRQEVVPRAVVAVHQERGCRVSRGAGGCRTSLAASNW